MEKQMKIDKHDRCFLYLLACALHHAPADETVLAGVDLRQLLAVARRHSTASMVCMALEPTQAFAKADAAVQTQWRNAKRQAIRKTMLLDAERKVILQMMEQQGIWHMPLKGTILKKWYPQFGMREMADNDILFDPAAQEQVRDWFVRRGYTAASYKKGNHDSYHKLPVYNFEMHVSLFDVNGGRLADVYRQWHIQDRLVRCRGTKYQFAFTPEDFYVFILAHAYKHYSLGGTGIRTLVDIYVMNQRLRGSLDEEYVKKQLTELEILSYAQEATQLADALFGRVCLPEDIILPAAAAETLQQYLDASTYGTMDRYIANQLRQLQDDALAISGTTKLRYLLSRLFPGRNWCRSAYPFFYKYPCFLPFFWLWRIGYRGIKGRKRLRQELHTVQKK